MKLRWRTPTGGAAVLVAAAALVGSGLAAAGTAATEDRGAGRPPACAKAEGPGQPPAPPSRPTLTTVGQVYRCIFDNYYSGPTLDSRSLLVPAFAAITQEMQRRGLDQPAAGLPPLTGRRNPDWAAFAGTYERIAGALPDDESRARVAAAAIQAMVDELDDNHARWTSKFTPNPYGLELSVSRAPGVTDPAAGEPAHVRRIAAGSPAANAGLRPGDVIQAVNDVPLYTNGVVGTGALAWLTDGAPGSTVKVTARRPVTGETLTVNLVATRYPPPPLDGFESRLLDGNIAYVGMSGFSPDLADKVLATIAEMRTRAELRGVILDLRGNGGGSPKAVEKLLGALAHGRITSYWCDVKGKCRPNHTDDSVALLNLPFVALTDRQCLSACDSFAGAVKDLELGTLVGTRTAGFVSGPGETYRLDNGSLLTLPKYHEISADKKIVDTIGVAPDHYVPATAADLSAGRDPALDKARSLM